MRAFCFYGMLFIMTPLQIPGARVREIAEQHGVSVMEAVLIAQKEEARSRLSKADLPTDLREVLLWLVERAS